MTKLFTTLLFVCIAVSNIFAISISSITSGDWGSRTSWSSNSLPADGDHVNINSGHRIEVESNMYNKTPTQLVLTIDGILSFDDAKLWLAENSEIYLNSGGGIESSGDSDNNEKIFIGSKTVWTQKDGNLYGPLVINENGPQPLPVTFKEVSVQDDQLVWEAIDEDNLSHYEIEYSYDGNEFEYFTSTTADEAVYYNEVISAGMYYRVVGVDYDGETTVSQVVYASNGETARLTRIDNGSFVASESVSNAILVDLNGYFGNVQFDGNEVNVYETKPGMYILKIQMGNSTVTEKIYID